VDSPFIGGEDLDIQKVAEEAVSGFGDYEYHYEDYEDDQNNRTARDLRGLKEVESNKNLHNLIKQMIKVSLRRKRASGKGCPLGYQVNSGDIPGWGSLSGNYLVANREECARKCDSEVDCASFEHSQIENKCNLNQEKNPTSQPYKDYTFCTKQEMVERKETKCVVKNLKCGRFPRLDECTGIGLGKCGGNAAILSALSSPHVLMVIVVTVSLLMIGAISASCYMYNNWIKKP